MTDENWHSNTHLVHAGTARTSNNETSEALFMTSGLEHKDDLIADILQALSHVS